MIKKINCDIKKWLLDETEYMKQLQTLSFTDFSKFANGVKKVLSKEIERNDIDDMIVMTTTFENVILYEDDTHKLTKVINMYDSLITDTKNLDLKEYLTTLKENLEVRKNNNLYKDDYKILEYLIFKDRNIDLLKYLILSKYSNLNLYSDSSNNSLFDKILDYFLKIEKDDLTEIKYFEEVLLLFILNMPKKIISSKRNNYLQKISTSKYFSNDYVRNIYNRICTYDNIRIEELEKKYHINFNFSPCVAEEHLIFSELNNQKRVDLTKQNCITIDSKNACCLDDAFYIKQLYNGNYLLYIHIIDAASYIKKDGCIEKEAMKRGSTLYLIDQNIPMFQENIGNRVCSLKSGVVKNAITYEIELDSNYNIVGNNIFKALKIYPSKIVVQDNLSYGVADEIIVNNKQHYLNILNKMASILNKDSKDKEIYRNIQNQLDSMYNNVKPKESPYVKVSLSSNIVQELMILTNRLLAEYFNSLDYPFIYRNNIRLNHDQIDIKTNDIYNYIKDGKYNLKELSYEKIREVTDIISRKGYYSLSNDGHYGLGLNAYSHCTSPARRYADFLSERLIYDFIFNKDINDKMIYNWEDRIKYVSNYLNEKEKENYMFESEYNFLVKRKLLKKEGE